MSSRHPAPLSYWYNQLFKRSFDVVFSIIMLVFVLWWITLILYIISFFGSREGLFFRQQRTGIEGKIFTCLKFRTMRANPEADVKQSQKNDIRLTPVGKYLRKLSLDELPQFINVLKGEMSVVGPRPHMLKHTEDYRKQIKRYMLRHAVKPGITGLAQVNGYRGEIVHAEDLMKRVECDVNYIEKWTFALDIKIIFLTGWVLIRGQKQAY
jgi:putative colanic acid biosynthesis UDP-glucose lipid carrier transferase